VFPRTKGYGFIKPTVGRKDVFVNISAGERPDLTTLNEKQVWNMTCGKSRQKLPRKLKGS